MLDIVPIDIDSTTLKVTSSKHGDFKFVKEFNGYGYKGQFLINQLSVDSREEILEAVKNDIIRIQLNDQIFEFLAPRLDSLQ